MKVVDSKKKKLSLAEIVIMHIDNVGTGGVPLEAAMFSVFQEFQMENAMSVQYGNTVFGGHSEPNGTQMLGRVFNVDTAENYINNMLKFAANIQKKGITHYLVTFDKEYGKQILPVLAKLKEALSPLGGNVGVGISEDEEDYMVFVLVPKKPIKRVA